MSHIELLPKWNVHHIWWERRDYTSRFDKAFRNATENKIAVPTINHNLMHANVSAPPKPDKQDMFNLLDYLEETPEAIQMDRLWALEKSAEYFGRLALEDTDYSFKARRIQDNLEAQMGYLALKLSSE